MSSVVDILFRGNAASAVAAAKETEAAVGGVGVKAEESAARGAGLATMFTGAKTQALELAKTFAPVVAALGAAEFAKGAITGAEHLEKAQSSLNAAIAHTGGDVDKLRPQYDRLARAAADFGVNQVDATTALARATLLTGSAEKAQRAYQEAIVISKATGRDLNTVLLATAKGQDGMTTSLRRYGILLDPTSTGQEQLTAVMKTFAGQAEANTTQSDKLHAQFSNLQTGIGTGLLPAFNGILQVLGAVLGLFSRHIEIVKVVVDALALLAAGYLTYIAVTKLAAAAQAAFNLVMDANPIGIVVIALAALVAAIILAYQHSETFRDIVQAVFNTLRSVVGGFVSFFTQTVPNAFNTVLNWLRSNWPIIATIISGPFAPIVALATNAFGVRTALEHAMTAVKDFVSARIDDVVGFFRSLPGRAVAAVAGIGNTLNSGLRNMRDFTSGIVGDIVGFFTALPGRIGHAAAAAGTAFVDGMSSGLAALGGALRRLIVDPLNAVISAWNAIGIPGFSIGSKKVAGVTVFPGFSFPGVALPDIPHLAAGGIISAPTLALVGESGPEAVVPLDRWNAGGGVTVSMAGANFYGAPTQQALDGWARGIATALERLGPGMALPAT